jgi:hypothetical protein
MLGRRGQPVQGPTDKGCPLAARPPGAYSGSMPDDPLLLFPAGRVPPAVQAMRAWCGPARERSWALRALSQYYKADVARLLEKSANLLARSRRTRIRLLA